MSEATIRAAIVSILDAAVTGVVHGRYRYSRSFAVYRDLLVPLGGKDVDGWMVDLASVSETVGSMGGIGSGAVCELLYTYRIVYQRTLDDGGNTAQTVAAQIEAAAAAIRAKPTLSGTADSILGPSGQYGLQIDNIDEDTLGVADGNLYHQVTCTLHARAQATR